MRRFASPEMSGKKLEDKLKGILNRPGLYYKDGMTIKDL